MKSPSPSSSVAPRREKDESPSPSGTTAPLEEKGAESGGG